MSDSLTSRAPQGRASARPDAAAAWQQLGWQLAGLVYPQGVARAFERACFEPPPPRYDAAAQSLLDSARADWALVTGQGGSRRIRVYRWGSRGPTVLLAHGWGGHAGQWHALVPALLQAGFRVAAFDALCHGASDAGAQGPRRSALPEMARALLAAAWHVGPVHAVVAHSLGGAAAAQAFREGLLPSHAVLIGAPADMFRAVSAQAWRLGIGPAVVQRVQQRAEQWMGMSWSAFNVPAVGRERQVPRTLVVHDRGDREVAWEDGAAIAGAWPGARLHTTDELGHRRILRDPDVLARVVAFLAPDAVAGKAAPLAEAAQA